jgi:hypothetical protein
MRLDRLPRRLRVLTACLLIGTSVFVTTAPRLVAGPGHADRIGSLEGSAQALANPTVGPIADPSLAPSATLVPVPTGTALPNPASQPNPVSTPKPPPKATQPPRTTHAPAPKPKPPVSRQKIVQFGTSGTQSQFLALMKNMSIDVIEMAPGTYRNWHIEINIDRTARPLTIRPARGTVTFDGAGSSSHEGLITAGWSGYTSHITFDGPFQITNYKIGQTGLIITDWASYLTFNGFTVRGTTAPSTNGLTAWAVYVSSDGSHHGSHLTFDYWNVDNSASSHKVSGLQLYHTPQATGVTALHWKVTGGYWGFVGRGNATGVKIEGWTISHCVVSFDSNGPAGIVKDMHASTSGAPTIRKPMVDGGGNVW